LDGQGPAGPGRRQSCGQFSFASREHRDMFLFSFLWNLWNLWINVQQVT
jgi:hypothetical protein